MRRTDRCEMSDSDIDTDQSDENALPNWNLFENVLNVADDESIEDPDEFTSHEHDCTSIGLTDNHNRSQLYEHTNRPKHGQVFDC